MRNFDRENPMADTSSERSTTSWLEILVGKVRAGDADALNQLLGHVHRRLDALTRRMLQAYPAVRQWEQTDDVLQDALIRLHRALQTVEIVDLGHFLHLAALQIRRALLTLAKRYSAAPRFVAFLGNTSGDGQLPGENPGSDSDLALWSEFHEKVEQLPDTVQAVFDLIFYHGMTQEEAAEALGVSDRTIRDRWRKARLQLTESLGGRLPGP
jgi:RNA polymerase sigma-70 factor (ECF subfamily)